MSEYRVSFDYPDVERHLRRGHRDFDHLRLDDFIDQRRVERADRVIVHEGTRRRILKDLNGSVR